MKGSVILGGWDVELIAVAVSGLEDVVSGTRTACPIRFRFWLYPKHPDMFNQLPHLFFCNHNTSSRVKFHSYKR